MNYWVILYICAFLSSPYCAAENGETKSEEVQNYSIISSMLKKLLEAVKSTYVPEINLEKMGRLSNVSMSLNYTKKYVEGDGPYGFKIDLKTDGVFDGYCDLHNIKIPNIGTIFGKGKFSIVLKDFGVLLHVPVEEIDDSDDVIVTIKESDFQLSTATIKFESLMNDADLTEFLNRLLSNLIPDLIQILNTSLKENVNKVLRLVLHAVIYCAKTDVFNFQNCVAEKLSPQKMNFENFQQNLLDFEDLHKADQTPKS